MGEIIHLDTFCPRKLAKNQFDEVAAAGDMQVLNRIEEFIVAARTTIAREGAPMLPLKRAVFLGVLNCLTEI